MNWGVEIQTYQTEGPENGQSLNIGQSPNSTRTECDNDTVKNVPAHLEVIVGVHSNELWTPISAVKIPVNTLKNTISCDVRYY